MTFGQILVEAKKRLGQNFFLFLHFEKQLAEELPEDWRNREDLITRENISCFFITALDILFMMATSFANTTDDPVYQDATRIAETIRKILQENFFVEIEPVEIMSPTRMMQKQGLLKIIVKDGEQFVQLTDEGKRRARRVAAANPGQN